MCCPTNDFMSLKSIFMKKVAQQPDITERTVPYRVLRTVPVTFLREPVWVVSLDTKVLGVLKVKL